MNLSYQLTVLHEAAKQKIGQSVSPYMPPCCVSPRTVATKSAVFALAMAAVMGANTIVFAQEEFPASYSRIFAGIFGDSYQGPGLGRVDYVRGDSVNFLWGVSALGETFHLGARVHGYVTSEPAYGQVVTSAYAEYGFAFRIVETQPPPWYASFGVPTYMPWRTFARLENSAPSSARTVHATAQIFINDIRIGSSFRDSPGVDVDFDNQYAWLRAGQIFTVDYRTSCTVANATTGGSATCEASADPIMKFDQAALDAYARNSGRQTYPLSDYYRIEYSPDIPIVPEPPTVTLLAAAGAILAIRHVRQNANRRQRDDQPPSSTCRVSA